VLLTELLLDGQLTMLVTAPRWTDLQAACDERKLRRTLEYSEKEAGNRNGEHTCFNACYIPESQCRRLTTNGTRR